jgi:hypothetical protein
MLRGTFSRQPVRDCIKWANFSQKAVRKPSCKRQPAVRNGDRALAGALPWPDGGAQLREDCSCLDLQLVVSSVRDDSLRRRLQGVVGYNGRGGNDFSLPRFSQFPIWSDWHLFRISDFGFRIFSPPLPPPSPSSGPQPPNPAHGRLIPTAYIRPWPPPAPLPR